MIAEALARELGKTPEMEDLYGPVIVVDVPRAIRELPEITTVDLTDLLSAQEREAEIERRDVEAALNLAASVIDVILAEFYGKPFDIQNEPAWLREVSEPLCP